jgi:hypothetical protein
MLIEVRTLFYLNKAVAVVALDASFQLQNSRRYINLGRSFWYFFGDFVCLKR